MLRANLSITASLVAMVLAVTLPLLVFAAYLVHSNTVQRRSLAVFSALAIARNVAAATDEFLDTAKSALPQLAKRIAFAPNGRLECDPLLPQFHALMPRIGNVTVFDRHGNLVCSALPTDYETFPGSSGDPWIAAPLRDGKAVLTGPRIGRITKKWISIYTHPIGGPDSEVEGVIAITIDLADFRPVRRQAGLFPGSIAGIIHADGTIVSRSSEPERWIGSQGPVPVHRVITPDGRTGSLRFVGVDGVERLYGFARIPETPWTAFAGLDAEAIAAEERRNILALLGLAVGLIALAGSGAIVFGRHISEPMHGVAEAARLLAAGGGRARAPVEGPREMRTVATEFNRMVDSRQATETELRDLAKRTRELADRLTAVEQSERVRISRELHDRIGQSLAILRLNLDVASAHMPETAPAELRKRLEQSRSLLETTIAHVRNVMADLRPPALDEYGLAAALRTYVVSFAASADVRVGFEAGGDVPRLTSVKETALFRIAQESLTNAAKHARAQSVRVTLAAAGSGVLLTIADDGIGFEPERLDTASVTWGITTMRERAEAIGAHLSVRSEPGHGTTVVVEVAI